MFHTGPHRTNHLRGNYGVEQTSTLCAEINEKKSPAFVFPLLLLPLAKVVSNGDPVHEVHSVPNTSSDFYFLFAEAPKKMEQQFGKKVILKAVL